MGAPRYLFVSRRLLLFYSLEEEEGGLRIFYKVCDVLSSMPKVVPGRPHSLLILVTSFATAIPYYISQSASQRS